MRAERYTGLCSSPCHNLYYHELYHLWHNGEPERGPPTFVHAAIGKLDFAATLCKELYVTALLEAKMTLRRTHDRPR